MSLNYTTGNPTNLTGGGTANMNDIQGTFTDIKTWADAKFGAADLTTTTLQTLGMNSGSQVGRGKSIIATSESRSNAAYGTLTTPDQVAGIVLPTDGLIVVAYKAEWLESVIGAARAAIFIGSNQLKVGGSTASPAVQETVARTGLASTTNLLTTMSNGLITIDSNTGYTGDVTTGQVVGNGLTGQAGPCYVFAAAGTYTVSVQFKASSGSVTAANRKLWVWTVGF